MKPLYKRPISLCMIVKNEAETLARCLKSVAGAVDELIVVDTGSTDGTAEIARGFGAVVTEFPWSGDFAAARNAGIRLAKGFWILVLDADEELDEASKAELLLCAGHPEYEAFFLRIHNHQGTERTSPIITVNPIIRLFRNRPEHRFHGAIHEQIAPAILENAPAAAMHLSGVVVHHYGYAAEIVVKKEKIQRNVRLLQEALQREPDNAFNHFNMAVEYMRLGDSGKALGHIRRSLETAGEDSSFVHLLYKYEVRCLAALEEFPAAVAACERGIALFPNYPDLHHAYGVLLLQRGAFSAAKAALQRAAAIGEAPPGYHTEAGMGTYTTLSVLARICEETGARQEAAACYAQALRLHPQRPWPLTARLIRAFTGTGREHELAGELRSIWGKAGAADLPLLAHLLIEEGCLTAAADWLETAEVQPGARTIAAPPATLRSDLAGQLRLAATADPAALTPEDVIRLLEHPLLESEKSSAQETMPLIRRARSSTALANRVLASLPLCSVYTPAAERARRTLPFSHTDL